MKRTTIAILSAGICGLLIQAAQADPITGQINMGGTATLNSPSLGSATADLGNSAVVISGTASGSYSGVPQGTSVPTFNGFAFTGASVSPLWSFTVGSWTYSFDLSSDHVVAQSDNFLALSGLGTLNITGTGSPYVATPGEWTFQITDSQGSSTIDQFSFSGSNNPVPDGAVTAELLGGTLLAVAMIRRKISC